MKIVVIIAGTAGIILILALVSMIPLYYLWNWLMPEIFGLKAITFWQAFGLSLLSGILFKSAQSND